MAGGRPRTFSFSPEEMEKLGQEMVDWCIQNDPLHLSQWYTIHKGYTYNEWKTFIQRPEFVPYYEKSLKIVGMKYLDGESKKVKEGISQRWQRIYFKDLKEEEDDTAKDRATLGQVSTDKAPNEDTFLTGQENMKLKHELERQKLEIQQLKEQLNAHKS